MDWTSLGKFWFVDWAIFVFLIGHIWLVGNRNRWGFILGIGAALASIAFGYMIGSVALVVMNITFLFLYARAFCRWTLPKQEPLRIAHGTWPDDLAISGKCHYKIFRGDEE